MTTLHADDIAVETSSRRGGRAPADFSDLLRRLAVGTQR
jgi:hypothetical protein